MEEVDIGSLWMDHLTTVQAAAGDLVVCALYSEIGKRLVPEEQREIVEQNLYADIGKLLTAYGLLPDE